MDFKEEQELELYKKRFNLVLTTAKMCFFEVDLINQRYIFFENSEALFGVSPEKILRDVKAYEKLSPEGYRKSVSRYFAHPNDEAVIEKAFINILDGKPATYEARMRMGGGTEYKWCRIDVIPIMVDGKPVHMSGVITDIGEDRDEKKRLIRAAKLDGFTGLYDKNNVFQEIRKSVSANADCDKQMMAVLDIDNLKRVNDIYGHSEGDKIILEMTARLKESFECCDILGRFGGDEFIIYTNKFSDMEEIYHKLDQITEFKVDDHDCSCSVGIAFYPDDGITVEELFDKADKALYIAKKRKEKYVLASELDK